MTDRTTEILEELGLGKEEIAAARGPEAANPITGLSWPPQMKNADQMAAIVKGTRSEPRGDKK
jgi:hypothetical protein